MDTQSLTYLRAGFSDFGLPGLEFPSFASYVAPGKWLNHSASGNIRRQKADERGCA